MTQLQAMPEDLGEMVDHVLSYIRRYQRARRDQLVVILEYLQRHPCDRTTEVNRATALLAIYGLGQLASTAYRHRKTNQEAIAALKKQTFVYYDARTGRPI